MHILKSCLLLCSLLKFLVAVVIVVVVVLDLCANLVSNCIRCSTITTACEQCAAGFQLVDGSCRG